MAKRKGKMLGVWVSERQASRIETTATGRGLSVSEFVRSQVVPVAEDHILAEALKSDPQTPISE